MSLSPILHLTNPNLFDQLRIDTPKWPHGKARFWDIMIGRWTWRNNYTTSLYSQRYIGLYSCKSRAVEIDGEILICLFHIVVI